MTYPCMKPVCRYPREEVCERHVQALWYDRNMRPERMLSKDGEEVRVVDPGEWNLGPGPDCLGAVLEVGTPRRRVKGDVEVHLKPGDWVAHAHAGDPAYANVIAHITWYGGEEPSSLPAGAIAVCIGRSFANVPWFSPEQIDLAAYPFSKLGADERPCRDALRDRPELARKVLAEAGGHRLWTKARRLAAIVDSALKSREQIFYEEVMGALGYGGNTAAFRRIAELVPWERLAAEPENALNALVAAAEFVDWPKRRGRPCNSPSHRLAAAPMLFSPARMKAMMFAGTETKAECRDAISLLTENRMMGRGRAAAVFANVIVPWALAEMNAAEVPGWLPPEDVSAPMRLTAHRLFGRDHNPQSVYAGNGLMLQGLVQIHREYCLRFRPECTACPIPRFAPPRDGLRDAAQTTK